MRILPRSWGSKEATLAVHTVADLADKTNSELHIVLVRPSVMPHYPGYYVGSEVVEHAQQKEQKHLDMETHSGLQ